jgi:hypothetical protein
MKQLVYKKPITLAFFTFLRIEFNGINYEMGKAYG